MGVEINLYPVKRAKRIEEIENLDAEVDKGRVSAAYLYKVYHDLLIVLQNEADPYENQETLAYKAVMGNTVYGVGNELHTGFVSSDEVKVIHDWLQQLRIDTPEGFEAFYNNISEEAKEELISIDSTEWEDIYIYAEMLLKLYDYAATNEKSVVVYAE
jgi:hypothetical protein